MVILILREKKNKMIVSTPSTALWLLSEVTVHLNQLVYTDEMEKRQVIQSNINEARVRLESFISTMTDSQVEDFHKRVGLLNQNGNAMAVISEIVKVRFA